jgi:peroxiredoxin
LNTAFPIIDISKLNIVTAAPLVVIPRPNTRGLLEVAGHIAAQVDEKGTGTPNLIVHFANERSVDHLDALAAALRESQRTDAATAILAVLRPEQMTRARHVEGVIYSEEQGGVWERIFNIRNVRHPLTLIAGPKGDAIWQQEGDIDREKLAGALRKHLISGASFKRSMLRLNLRMGHPAPNFLFEIAPGQQLTLRKLAKKPVILLFWRSSAKQSVAAVHDLEGQIRKYGKPEPVVLAINDGEPAESAKRTAAENRFKATVVMDPKREISEFYGVNIWPTTVFIDAFGLVRTVQYGRSYD